jgi:hypothetical protein
MHVCFDVCGCVCARACVRVCVKCMQTQGRESERVQAAWPAQS